MDNVLGHCNPWLGATGLPYRQETALSCREQEFPYFMLLLCGSTSPLVKECWRLVLQKGGSNNHRQMCTRRTWELLSLWKNVSAERNL